MGTLREVVGWVGGVETFYRIEIVTNIPKRVVKGIFVSRERPFYFSVKCEIAISSLVNRDYVNDLET